MTTSVVNHCSAVTSDLCIFVCGPEWGMGGQGRGKYLSNYIIFIFVFGWVVTTSKSDSYTGTLGMEKDISSRELETLKWLSYVLLANIVSHSHCRWYLVHRPWDYLKYNIDRGQIPAYKLIILMNNPVGYFHFQLRIEHYEPVMVYQTHDWNRSGKKLLWRQNRSQSGSLRLQNWCMYLFIEYVVYNSPTYPIPHLPSSFLYSYSPLFPKCFEVINCIKWHL